MSGELVKKEEKKNEKPEVLSGDLSGNFVVGKKIFILNKRRP